MADDNPCEALPDSPAGFNSKTFKILEDHKKTTDGYLRRLYINVGISFLFMIGEIAGGVISGSIALLTDAFHILSDIFAFGISIAGLHLSRRPASKLMTYGFYRAEVIGTLLSIAIIWGLTAWLVAEAIDRITNPEDVNGLVMLVTALAGLVANIIMALLLGHGHHHHHHHHHDSHDCKGDNGKTSENLENNGKTEEKVMKKGHSNLNMRAAFIHVLGDGLQSVGVSIAGGIIYAYPEYRIADPLCTLFFCIIVIFTTVPILRDCLRILMEASPKDIEIDLVNRSLKELEDVIDVHDLHIWSLSAGKLSLSCHLISNEHKIVLDQASKLLKEKFGIGHVTIQVEGEDSTDEFECENELHT
jgi:cation diffusion facilitator family transporter